MRNKADNEEILRYLSGENKIKEEKEEESTELPSDSPVALQIEYLRAKLDKQKEEVESLKQDREQRKVFGNKIYYFMVFYMAASLLLVYLVGFSAVNLSDSVLITLLTTTLANVIGLFAIVAKYLFHPKD